MAATDIQTIPLMDATKLHVIAAWADTAGRVFLEEPKYDADAPYVAIEPGDVNISFEGVLSTLTETTHDNSFVITAFFPYPTDPTVQINTDKVNRANALIAQIQSGELFVYPAHDSLPAQNIGTLPLVTGVSFENLRGATEAIYSITLSFLVFTSAAHH